MVPVDATGVIKMANKLQSVVWCQLDGFDPFPVTYAAGRDKCVLDACFNLSGLESSVHKLLVLCREGCGFQHVHTIFGDGRVGVEIAITSEGIFAVISGFLYLSVCRL